MKMSRLSVNVLVALSLAVAHHSARAEVPFAQCPTQEQCGTSYRPTWTLHVTLLNAPSLAQMPDSL